MTSLGAGGVTTFPGATSGASYPQYFGIFFGVVNNNADPNNSNRCLLQVPQLFGTAVTTWATSLTPLQNPPKVGTVITAMFIGGDVDYPVYLVTDPQILVESTAGNIQPIGTTASAGTSKKLAAADHVHGNISTLYSDMQPDDTSAAAGSSGRVADAQHVHPIPASMSITSLTASGSVQASTVQATTYLIVPGGYFLSSQPSPTIVPVSGTADDGDINYNFSVIASALQAAGIWH